MTFRRDTDAVYAPLGDLAKYRERNITPERNGMGIYYVHGCIGHKVNLNDSLAMVEPVHQVLRFRHRGFRMLGLLHSCLALHPLHWLAS
jgi:hypothetical protein